MFFEYGTGAKEKQSPEEESQLWSERIYVNSAPLNLFNIGDAVCHCERYFLWRR